MKKLINIIFSIIFVVMLLFSFKSFSNEDGGLNFLNNIFSKEKTDDFEILYRNVEKHKDDNEKTMWIYENFENLENKDKYLVGNDIDASEFIYNLRNNRVNFDYYPGVSVDYGRKTPYFLQWDNRWAYNMLGDSNIGFAGCGPTSMAMVLKRLNPNLDISPIDISNDAQSYMSSSGIEWKFFSDEAKRYGYNIQSIENNKNSIIDALDKGSLIVSVKKGDFTLFGHILVIDSYKFGRFIINDPNSMKNSEKTWSYGRIKNQIVNIWLVY